MRLDDPRHVPTDIPAAKAGILFMSVNYQPVNYQPVNYQPLKGLAFTLVVQMPNACSDTWFGDCFV